MNKYQEALIKIGNYEDSGAVDNTFKIKHMFSDEVDLLQELVDKETPMKPIKGEGFTVHDCPTCDDGYIEVDGYYKLNRCVNCGQRIDWSNNNE